MTLFQRRRHGLRGAMDKIRGATHRFVEFCDNTIGAPTDDGGKVVLRELRRFLRRDMPRYFKRLPVPHSFSDVQMLTLRDWMHLAPLIIVTAVLYQRSPYLLLIVAFLITLVNA